MGLNKTQKREVLDQVGELLVEQVLQSVADSKSPIDGSKFAKLSKEYAEKKLAETGSKEPNLDLHGDMMQALDFKVKGDDITLGVFGEDAPKADGHNNFSGKSRMKERRFLPAEGQLFEDSILSLVKETIESYKSDNLALDENELKKIDNKSDLYEYLQSEFEGLSNSRIKELVLQSELSVSLDKFDLLDLL